ncbi:MAG: hypothetical protein M1828_004540 [Chrysothrix sp. TS-e1954]|nr:MAG: hypothetical protein M1828_004540 [Chrysothrix sp. TS-e1954]
MGSRYPSKHTIQTIFSHLSSADFPSFLSHALTDAKWTLMSTTPLGTTFNDSTTFMEETFGRFSKLIDPEHPVSLVIDNIIGGGDEEWSVTEMRNLAVSRDSKPYDQKYAWVVRWSEEGDNAKIVEGRVYLDSALTERVIAACEH